MQAAHCKLTAYYDRGAFAFDKGPSEDLRLLCSQETMMYSGSDKALRKAGFNRKNSGIGGRSSLSSCTVHFTADLNLFFSEVETIITTVKRSSFVQLLPRLNKREHKNMILKNHGRQ